MGTIINALPTQSGGILDAPTDGRTYGRKDSNWQVITDSDLGGFDDGDFTLVASFKSLYNY